jgi:hypothetical protein
MMSENSINTESKNSFFYTWADQEGILKQYLAECLTAFAVFEIQVVPKFDSNRSREDEKLYFDSLMKQKSFLDTFFSLFLNQKQRLRCNMELRIVSNPIARRVQCFIVFKMMSVEQTMDIKEFDKEIKRLKTEFYRIFPKDYLIKEISQDAISNLLQLDPSTFITEVIKTPKLLTVGTINDADDVVIADRFANDQNGQFKHNIPCCSYLEPKPYNFYNFYRLLMDVDFSAHVRIAVGAADVFDAEKHFASIYQNMILRYYSQTGNYEVQNYLKSFNKYLSANELYSLKLQVACATESQSLEVANSLCTQLSYGEINTISHLKCYSLKGKAEQYIRGDWEECNHYHYWFAETKQLIEDVNLMPFMRRQTSLYDISEVMSVFRLPLSDHNGLPGFYAKPVRPFYQPSLVKTADKEESIYFGTIERSIGDDNIYEYSVPMSSLLKHGLIVGATGSGKTNTTLSFIRSLDTRGVSFLLIEPVKSEYFKELQPHIKNKPLVKFDIKSPWEADGKPSETFLKINPFIPLDGISLYQHIAYIKGCITAAFPMYGITSSVLESCLISLYRKSVDENDKVMFMVSIPAEYKDKIQGLSFKKLLNEIVSFLESNESFNDDETMRMIDFLTRRIEKFTTGVLGHIFCPELWQDGIGSDAGSCGVIQKILTEPAIVELEHLPDNDDKALIMAFILTYMFEHRQRMDSITQLEKNQGDKFVLAENIHITIIEEAHRLLSSGNLNGTGTGEDQSSTMDAKSASITLFVDMLAEIRSKGEGIFIVEQIPTKLIADVVKNTNLKIMHRITSKEDRNYLGETMNMNEIQKNFVSTLKTGDAIIFDEQVDYPVFVKIERFPQS